MTGAKSDTHRWGRASHLVGILFLLLVVDDHSIANPSGASVVHGSASIGNNPADANHLIINQSTDKAIINWQDFSIGENEHTQFIQPNANSFTLNRVTGGNESQILGRLSANGRLMLINPAGILFGPNSRVDVASIVASTADISNQDFLAGNYIFTQNPAFNAPILNYGSISVADTGFAALVAPGVANYGVINARMGTVVMAAGMKHTMDLYGDGLINFVVNEGITSRAVRNNEALQDTIKNEGYIYADGGNVLISAKSAPNVVESVINLKGYTQAKSVVHRGDRIVLNGSRFHAPKVETYAKKSIKFEKDHTFDGDFDSYWHMYSGGDIDFNQKNVYATGLGGQSLLLNSNGGTIWLNPADGIYTNGGRLYVTNPNGITYQSGHFDLTGTGGPQNSLVYNDPVVLTSDTTLTDPTSIIFNNTIDGDGLGPWNLTVRVTTANGTLTFNDDIGATNPLSSLFARTAGGNDNLTLNLSQINTIGDTTIWGNNMNIAQSLTINANNIQLGASFNNTIQSVGGNHDLTFNTTGGGLTDLHNLDGPFGNLTTNADGTTQISIVGFFFGAADNTANFTGDVVFNNPVLIDDESFKVFSRLQANNVTFNSTVNLEPTFGANYNYEILATGTVNFNGTVGTTNPMNQLTVIAPTININTPTITANDIVTLNGGTVLGSNLLITAGAFTNTGTINSDATPRNLTINASGNTALGTLGNTAALSSVTTDAAGTVSLGGNITTVNAQNYNDTASLTANTVLTSTAGSNLGFAGALNGGGFDLTLNTSGTSSLVGGVSNLNSLTTDAAGSTELTGTLTVASTMDINDTLNLLGATTLVSTGGGNIDIATLNAGGNDLTINTTGNTTIADVTGAAVNNLTTNAGGQTRLPSPLVATGTITLNDELILDADTQLIATNINLDLVNGNQELILNASNAVNLNDIIGGTTPLDSLTINGAGTLFLGTNITAQGNTTTINVPTVLVNNATITEVGPGNIIFNNTIDSDGLGTWTLTLNTPNATQLNGNLGATNSLFNLVTDAGGTTLINAASASLASITLNDDSTLTVPTITTTGDQAYNNFLTLSGNTVLTSTGGGNINLDVVFAGNNNLTLNTTGITQLNDEMNDLGTLITDAAGTTHINVADPDNIEAVNITFNDPVELLADMDSFPDGISVTGSLTFNSTINGAFAFNIEGNNTATVTFNGTLGNSTPLDNINIDNFAQVNIAQNMTADGPLVIDSPTVLTNDIVLTSLNNRVQTLDTVNSDSLATPRNLTISAVNGGVTLDTYGNVAPLNNLVVTNDGTSNITLEGGSITTVNNQTYNGPVEYTNTITLNANAVTFNDTVDGRGEATLPTITINTTGGPITYNGDVGTGTGVQDLTHNGPVIINTANIETQDFQTYNGVTTLTADTQLTAGTDININNTFDGNFNLVLDANDFVNINANIGDGVALSTVTTTNNGVTRLGADITAQGGTITFNNPVQMTNNSTLTDSGPTGVLFNNTLDGDGVGTHDLTVNTTGGGTTLFGNTVGGTNPVGSITTDAAGTVQVNTANVTTTNAQTYNETMTTNQATINLNTTDVTAAGLVNIVDGQLGASTINVNAGGFITTGLIADTANLSGATGVNGTGLNIANNLSVGGLNGGALFGSLQGNTNGDGDSAPFAATLATLQGGAAGSFFLNGCLIPGAGNCTPATIVAINNQQRSINFPTEEVVEEEDVVMTEEEADQLYFQNSKTIVEFQLIDIVNEDDKALYPTEQHDYLCSDCSVNTLKEEDEDDIYLMDTWQMTMRDDDQLF